MCWEPNSDPWSSKCSSLRSLFSGPWKFLPAVNAETTAGQYAETRRQLSAQLGTRHQYRISLSTEPRVSRRLQESGAEDIDYETVLARYDKAIAHMNSSGCGYAQDRVSLNPRIDAEGLVRLHPKLRSYWELRAAEEGRCISFRDVAPERLPISSSQPWTGAHTRSTEDMKLVGIGELEERE